MENEWILERHLNYGYLAELNASQLFDVLQDVKALLKYKIMLARVRLQNEELAKFEAIMKGLEGFHAEEA